MERLAAARAKLEADGPDAHPNLVAYVRALDAARVDSTAMDDEGVHRADRIAVASLDDRRGPSVPHSVALRWITSLRWPHSCIPPLRPRELWRAIAHRCSPATVRALLSPDSYHKLAEGWTPDLPAGAVAAVADHDVAVACALRSAGADPLTQPEADRLHVRLILFGDAPRLHAALSLGGHLRAESVVRAINAASARGACVAPTMMAFALSQARSVLVYHPV